MELHLTAVGCEHKQLCHQKIICSQNSPLTNWLVTCLMDCHYWLSVCAAILYALLPWGVI